MPKRKTNCSQTIFIVSSLILLIVSLGLQAGGVMSPSWQVMDFREYRATHHHGLWLDCTRPTRQQYSKFKTQNDVPLYCTYKVDYNGPENSEDIDKDSMSEEPARHQYLQFHKFSLGFMLCGILLAFLSLLCGICAPCSFGFSVLYAILVAFTALTAFCGDVIFFFAACRTDNRFVKGLLATYEQEVGLAFHIHVAGTAISCIVLIMAATLARSLLLNSDSDRHVEMRELVPLHSHAPKP